MKVARRQQAITIGARLSIPISALGSSAELEALKRAFTYPNPDHAKWKALKLRSKPPPSEVWMWEIAGGNITLPRGALARVRDVVRIDIAVEHAESSGLAELAGRIPRHSVELWPFQEQMVRHAIAHQVCCLRAPPAAGKTTAALALASRVNLPTLVIVWTGALAKQWIERCASELNLHGDEVGLIQGNVRRIRPITIGMQQTLVNCIDDYAHMFGVVICDELQRFASETFSAVIDRSPALYRIGVSADERRADGKEFLIYDMFGEVAFEVERDALEDAGRIIDVEVRVIPTEFDLPWYRDLVARSRFGSKQKLALAFNRVLHEMTNDPARNAIIGEIAATHVDDGQLVVALSHRREHCSVLSAEFDRVTGGRGGILLGGTGNAEEYDRAKIGLKSGAVRAAAATYQAFGTGMDIPGLEVGVFTTPVANSKKGRMQFDQYRGRFARSSKGKTAAVVYYVWDGALYGVKPLKNLASWCKRVSVRHDGQWVPVRTYLQTARGTDAQAQRHNPTADTGGLFYDPRAVQPTATVPAARGPRRLRSRTEIRR